MIVSSLEQKVYSVIVIGPMADRGLGVVKKTVPVSQHIKNICEAVRWCESALQAEDPEIELRVQSAFNIDANGITDTVMRMMDEADFAIADIAFETSATMYEVAMLHAMGVPTLFLDYNYANNISRKSVFYLKDQKQYWVDDFDVEHIANALAPALPGVLKSIDDGELVINPISTHYSSYPLMEASSVTGLAAGQFYNFLRHVIDEQGAIAMSGDDFTKLVVVEPKKLQEVGAARARVSKIAGYQEGLKLTALSQPRGNVIVSAIGKTIIDFPTPVSAVTMSPRFQVFLKFQNMNAPNAPEKIDRFEKRLIKKYMNALKMMARSQPSADPSLLTFMTVDEIIDAADRGAL